MPDVTSGALALPIPLDSDPVSLLAETVRDMADQLELQLPAPPLGFLWTLSGATSNPSLGNALSRGQYWRIGDDLIRALYYVKFGTTSTYGGGLWRFTLPFPALQPVIGGSARPIPYWGDGVANDSSAGVDYRINGLVDRGDNTKVALKAVGPTTGQSVNMNPTTPFAWDTNDELLFQITYQCES